jgi:hypothetical protein
MDVLTGCESITKTPEDAAFHPIGLHPFYSGTPSGDERTTKDLKLLIILFSYLSLHFPWLGVRFGFHPFFIFILAFILAIICSGLVSISAFILIIIYSWPANRHSIVCSIFVI